MSTLQSEFQTYERQLSTMLVEHEGEFVVIKGTKAEQFCPTYESALTWGYTHIGLDTFFVKKVAVDHDVVHFTRDLGPCRA